MNKTSLTISVLLLAAIAATGFWMRSRGHKWPDLHPDSDKIVRWMITTSTNPYFKTQVYPGGFFAMFRPVQRLALGPIVNADPPIVGGTSMPRIELKTRLLRLARLFNAWLGALTCVFAFLLARSVFRSDYAGAAGAAAVAFWPFHVEHCHYAETDIAMVFTLMVALAAWTIFFIGPCGRRFTIACLAAGLSAGTKFPMLVLVLFVFSAFFVRTGAKSGFRVRALWFACGSAAFLLGFAAFNPAILMEPAWFFARLRADAAGTMAESEGIIGFAHGRPLARFMHQSLWLWRFLGALGLPALAALAAGTAVMFASAGARSRGKAVMLFSVTYLLYLILAAPWMRMQESFPLLPLVACAAGGLAAVALDRMRRSPLSAIFRFAAGAVVVVFFAASYTGSLWRSGLFKWDDTRGMAEQWLKRSYPPEAVLGLEVYARIRNLPNEPVTNVVHLHKIDRHSPRGPVLGQCDYVLRNETMPGRGQINPFTGGLYDGCRENLAGFLENAEPLRTWSPCPPMNAANFAFVSPTLSLLSVRGFDADIEVEIPIARPMFIAPGRVTYIEQGHGLGAAEVVPVTKGGASAAVGWSEAGPPDNIFAVVFTMGEPVHVSLSGFGGSAFIGLSDWDAYAVEFRRPAWMPRTRGFEKIKARTVTGSRETKGLTFLTAAFSAREALWILTALGRRMRALDFMDEAGLNAEVVMRDDNELNGVARLDATRHLLAQWADQARENAKTALGVPSERLRINGIAAPYHDSFAKLSLPQPADVSLERPDASGDFAGEALLPVILPGGRWRFACRVKAFAAGDNEFERRSLRVKAGRSKVWKEIVVPRCAVGADDPENGIWTGLELDIEVGKPCRLALEIGSDGPARLRFYGMTIGWSLRELLEMCAFKGR